MEEEHGQTQITQSQVMQMAQQEEYNLMNKKRTIEKISEMLNEATTTKETLKELSKTKGKIQIAIGATIIIEASIENNKTCKRGFAENGYKEEKIEDTILWLEKKEGQIKKQLEKLQKEAYQSNAQLTSLMSILKQMEKDKKSLMSKMPPTISR